MFKKLFDATGKFLIFIMFFLLLASFAVWGVGDVLRNNYNDTAAKVDDTKISKRTVQEIAQQRKNQFLMATGQTEINEDLSRLLESSVLRQLVNQALLEAEAKTLGIVIDGKQVIKSELANDKTMTKEKFQNFLRSVGKSEGQYIVEVGQQRAIDYVEQAVTTNPPVTDYQVKLADSFQNEKRTYEYIDIPESYVKNAETPTEEQLKSFYEENKQLYSVAEQRDATVLLIDKAVLSKESAQSNVQKVESYHNEPGDLDQASPKSTAEQLYAFSNKVLDKVAEGKTLEEIAAEYNLQVTQVKNISASVPNGALPHIRNYQKAIFAAEKGNVSELMEDDRGEIFSLFRVDSITPARQQTYDEVASKVKEQWQAFNKHEQLAKIAEDIATQAAKDGFEKTAAAKGLKIKKSAEIARDANNIPAGLINEIFLAENKDKVTKSYANSEGGFVVARLDTVVKSNPDQLALFTAKSTLQEQMKQDLLQQYLVYLSGKHKVKISN